MDQACVPFSNVHTVQSWFSDIRFNDNFWFRCFSAIYILADSGFFKNFLYQGGVKSTVSGVFEDLKFKISEGYQQNWSFPVSALLAVSVNSKNLVRPLICISVWSQFRFPRALMNSTAEIESVCTKKLDLRKKGVNFLYSKATWVEINSEGAFIFICLCHIIILRILNVILFYECLSKQDW